MAFTDIPIRKNGQIINASWFNTIRNELINNGHISSAFKQYISDSAYAQANPVVEGSVYYNTTINRARVFQEGNWYNLGGEVALVVEKPIGNVNGINKSFNITNVALGDIVDVSINGLRVNPNQYTYNVPTITFLEAPKYGQEVLCSYLTSGAIAASVVQEGTYQVIYHTVTSDEEISKQITLPISPAVHNKVVLDVVGGVSQEYAVDYIIDENILSWNNLGLDGIITTGDVLRIIYFS